MQFGNRHASRGFLQTDAYNALKAWVQFTLPGVINLPVMGAGASDLAGSFTMPEQLPAERAFFSGLSMTGHGMRIQAFELANAAKGAEFMILRNGRIRRSA